MRIRWLVLLLLAPIVAAPAQEAPPAVESVGVVKHEPIDEMSGIVRSRTYPGVWWVHNDGGGGPRLYAIDAKGDVVVPAYVAKDFSVGEKKTRGKPFWKGIEVLLAANVDWEDIALADGHLYVAEMGNNFNHRRDLGVYVIPEPNPTQTVEMRPLVFLPVRYPDQDAFPPPLWHYDCESIFVSEGKLYFLTKHRLTAHGEFVRGTKLYRLDTRHVDRANVLTRVDEHPDLALPTGADLSPDGKRLAVLTALALWTFEKPAEGDRWLSGKARRIMLPRERTIQAEAVCWDDDETLRITNEQRSIFRVAHASLVEVEPAKPR